MFKPKKLLFFLSILFLLLFYPLLFAEESVTITTYYPSPYGVYNSLQTDKLGVGDFDGDGLNSADVPITSGEVWIKGKVGIGTRSPGGFFGNANAFHIYNSAGSGELRIQGGSGNGILELDASTGADWHVQNSGGTFTITETSSAPDRLTILSGGSVGIGTAAPGALLSVGSNTFQVNSSGNLTKVNNVGYSWPSSQGGGSTALTNDGSGNLSWGAGGGGWTGTFNAYPRIFPGESLGSTCVVTITLAVTNGLITSYSEGAPVCGYDPGPDSSDDSG